MTGLRRLRILDSSRHNPAVGNLYCSKPLGRLLIVGLSHYGSESEVKRAGFTQAVVGAVIGGKRIPYFTKISRLFSDSNGHPYLPCDFYPLVAFYNFLPYVFRVRQRVEEDQWLNPDAQPFFFRVIDYVQPHRVLITGEQLWRALPSRLPGAQGARRVREDGTGLYVPFGGDDRECCWYSVEGAEDCLVGAITHPSTPKFNLNHAAFGRWVQKFMTWNKRVPPPASAANTLSTSRR